MNPLVDFIVAGLLLFFFLTGWIKGFIRTVIGPIALIVGSVIAWIYYKQTQNFLVSILISLIAPFVIQFGVLTILKIYNKSTDKNDDFFTIGRLLGGVLNLLWGGAITVLTIILLVLIPSGNWEGLQWTQSQIKSSYTFDFIDSMSGKKLSGGTKDVEQAMQMLQDPKKMESLQNTDEYNEIMQDKKMQAIFNDAELVKDLEAKNFTKLMNNPKVLALLQDPELIQKLLKFQQYLAHPPEEKKKSGPKVINVK